MVSIFKKISRALRSVQERHAMPLRLEFVVGDQCNLNCRGCTHFSPLAAGDQQPFEQLKATVERVAKAVSDEIPIVYLMGGETLLYPRIVEAIELMRANFPKASLSLFTNGLLLTRMGDDFWEACRRCQCRVAMTRYPVKFDYDAAEALVREKGVECRVFGDRGGSDTFFRFALDPAKSQNAELAHFKCYNFGCVSVVGDRIYPCSISGCVGHLNRAHATDFRHEEGDYIRVEDLHSVKQIKRLRDRPTPFCAYCKLPPRALPWAASRREKSEWVD